jgi:hypothetical protein
MNTKFLLRRSVVVLAIAFALGTPTHSQPVASWKVVVLSPMQMPTAAIALVVAATRGSLAPLGRPLRSHGSRVA